MTSRNDDNSNVYLVIHHLLPIYDMYLDNKPYSEPIETVNATVVSVHKSYREAKRAAKSYFFDTLEHEDSGESENGGYHFRDSNGDSGTWEEEVFVETQSLQK